MVVRRPAYNVSTVAYTQYRPPDGRVLVVDYEAPAGAEERLGRLAMLAPADPASTAQPGLPEPGCLQAVWPHQTQVSAADRTA